MKLSPFFALGAICASDSPCPSQYIENQPNSGCWTYTNGKCVKTNPECVKLTCLPDRMEASIRPDTFGIQPDEYYLYQTKQKKISLTDQTCDDITWNPATNTFNVISGLGQCGMTVGDAMVNDKEYITFRLGMNKEQETNAALAARYPGMFLATSNAVSLDIECRYLCTVTTGSEEVTISQEEVKDELDLRFEVDVRTTYITDKDLLDPKTEKFQHIAGQIVHQVENNWVGPKPWKVGINHFMFFYDELATAVKDNDLSNLFDREGFFNNEGGNERDWQQNEDSLFQSQGKRKRREDEFMDVVTEGTVQPRDYFPTETDKLIGSQLHDDDIKHTDNNAVIPIRETDGECTRTRDELVKVRIRVYYKHLTEDDYISDAQVASYKQNIVDTIEEVKKLKPSIIDPCEEPEVVEPPVIERPTKGYDLDDSIISYGSWDSKFSIGAFNDPNFVTPVSGTVIAGKEIYVKVDWNINVGSATKFFVKDCTYYCGTSDQDKENFSIDLVKTTCYADFFKAKLTNPSKVKVVSRSSTFAFATFGFKNAPEKCALTCDLKVCVGDKCITPKVCPNEPAFLRYSLYGIN